MVSHEIALNRVQADANTIYKLALLRGIKRYSPHLENMEENLGWFKYFLRRTGRYLIARSHGEKQIFPAINNVAEHSLLVVHISLILAKYENVDAGEIAVIASLHDATEILTGDATPYGKPFVNLDEESAWNALVADSAFSEFTALYKEYEARETLIARVVKSADIIASVVEMQIAKSQGHKYPAYQKASLRSSQVKRESLKKQRIKGSTKLFDCLERTSPFAWMRTGENSFSNGRYGIGTKE